MGRGWLRLFGACALAAGAPASAAPFDPSPWLADLEQARQALHDKYANLEWVESEREVSVDALFSDAAKRLARAGGDSEARAVFERIQSKLGDGHVEIAWPDRLAPARAPAPSAAPPPDFCGKIGYDARQNSAGTASALPGYAALADPANPFDAGLVNVGDTRLGVIRIGIFQPQGYPELCRAAVRALSVPQEKPCNEHCQDLIITWAYARLTGALEERVRKLKSAGASALLVDISNNGGGSEWAEAAARIFSRKPLVSERRGFVRGEHWAKQWRDLAADLRSAAAKAPPGDRARLLAWASEADAAEKAAQTPCPAGSRSCTRLGTAGYSTGLVGSSPSGSFAGRDWAVRVFSPAQFPYHDGVWDGPLLVLVDQETWSAAEEFAAVLQDNNAAVIIGARTGGAGCGYTNGGTPTLLKNSGAVLKLPDCVRFRADGSNEVRGILPDEPLPIRADDGVRFRASLIAARLPGAIARAKALFGESR